MLLLLLLLQVSKHLRLCVILISLGCVLPVVYQIVRQSKTNRNELEANPYPVILSLFLTSPTPGAHFIRPSRDPNTLHSTLTRAFEYLIPKHSGVALVVGPK